MHGKEGAKLPDSPLPLSLSLSSASLELPDYPHNGANLWAVAMDIASGDALLSLQTFSKQHSREQLSSN